ESNKYAVKASTDGGLDPAQYDIGTNLTLTPFTHGLVGYWTLDETSGSIAQDWSGYGNTLTAGALGSSASWSTGKIGNSFQLLASAKTNTTPCPIGLSTGIAPSNILYNLPQSNFSISMWSNLSAGGALFHLYTQYTYSTSFTGMWGRDVTIEVANSLSQYTPLAGIVVPKDSLWHHVVYVFDINNSTQSLYIDGIKTKTVQNLSANYGNPSSIHFGTYDVNWCGAGHALVGLLDDIRIYRRALRDDEIVGLYNVYK
ncbi:MAG: LamG-like jellyroll fold domain-containing protein, partial [Candidatus Paceibacterota bacterium]